MLRKIMNIVNDTFEKLLIWRSKLNEKKKYKDSRRVSIYSQVALSEEQKAEIDKLYMTCYGEKIPYTWHRHFTAFTGNFDVKYFPELLFIPEFERYMSDYQEYARVFTDKNMLPMLAACAGVKTTESYLTATKGVFRDSNNRVITKREALRILADVGEVFIKPTVDTSSGNGCFIANFETGVDKISQRTPEELLAKMGRDFAVQKRLKCHEQIAKIYDGSVNTFRVITYRWKDKFYALPIIMRIGSGGNFLDNAHAGGMFIAVNNDGTLHKTAFTEFKQEYTEHPDTHIVFNGYIIESIPDLLKAALRLHECIPQLGCVNWDLTIDETGAPVLVEANINNRRHGGSIWLCEMAHGCGAFGDNTEEILKWLKVMKKTPRSQWYKYEFGQMPDEIK